MTSQNNSADTTAQSVPHSPTAGTLHAQTRHLSACAYPAPWQVGRYVLRVWMVFLALALCLPLPAYADAPGTRGDPPLPEGSTAQSSADASLWQDVHPLAPPTAVQPRNRHDMVPSSEPSSWFSRSLNPGMWVLDAGMGVFAGVILTFGETIQRVAATLIRAGENVQSWTIIPSSCRDNAATNFVFCTPSSLTYNHPGMQAIWSVMRAVAQLLITLLFVVRMSRLLAEGQQSFVTEGKGLVLTFLGVSLFVNSTQATLQLLIDLFNAISDELLTRASFEMPTPIGHELNAGAALIYALFWVAMAWLIIKNAFRVVHIMVLVGLAPLAGALLMDRSTAPRFYGWLGRLFDLLIEQVALAATMIVAVGMMTPLRGGADQVFTGYVLGLLTLLVTVLGSERLTGMAQSVTQGMPLVSRIQGFVWRHGKDAVVTRATGAANRVASASGDFLARRGIDGGFKRTAREVLKPDGNGRSAAAPRTLDGRVPFRMPVADSRTRREYDRLRVRAITGDRPDEARRKMAAIHARGMRIQADEIRRGIGFRTPGDERLAKKRSAADLERRARLQEAFADGRLRPRPSPWSADQQRRRRDIARAALLEAQAEHRIEREETMSALHRDERDLPTAPPDQRAVIIARIQEQQARVAALTPAKGMTVAAATRAHAAALMRQRLAAEGLATPPRIREPWGMEKLSSPVRRPVVVVERRVPARSLRSLSRSPVTPSVHASDEQERNP
jgi:hypothetical protein